jgi:hypothetical protein
LFFYGFDHLISLNCYSFHVANAIWESNISGWNNAQAGRSIIPKILAQLGKKRRPKKQMNRLLFWVEDDGAGYNATCISNQKT